MKSDRILDLIVPAAIALAALPIFWVVHPGQRLLFVPSMVVAFVCYLRTSYREMPRPERVLPIY
ncbi:MAG: HXXEE domain-containing protein, partial [Verrucomicrobiota bacterium]|nr:HXXEE domain-containing protein [Verrucomicrobiota bacterium]